MSVLDCRLIQFKIKLGIHVQLRKNTNRNVGLWIYGKKPISNAYSEGAIFSRIEYKTLLKAICGRNLERTQAFAGLNGATNP